MRAAATRCGARCCRASVVRWTAAWQEPSAGDAGPGPGRPTATADPGSPADRDRPAGARPRGPSTAARRSPTPSTPSTRPDRARARLAPADMLVYDPDSLSDETIAAIRAARRRHRRRVAGAGPGEHREQGHQRGRGRPGDVPQLHAVRERRAPRRSGTGWPAASSRSGRRCASRLPTDEKDYLRLGSDKDAPQVHVGAYAPQVAAGRRGRQRDVGRDAGHEARQRAARLHRAAPRPRRCASRSSGSSATRPRSRCSTPSPASASTPASSRPRSSSARSPTRSAPSTTPCSAAAGSPRTRRGCAAHIRTETVPILGLGDLQPG